MGKHTEAWVMALGLAAWSSALGCDLSAPDDDAMQVAARAVRHGNQAMDGQPRLAYVGALFAVDPSLDPSDPDAMRRAAVQAVHDRLALTFQSIGCDAELDTDGDATVSVHLQGCRLVLWTVDAEIEGTARVETEGTTAVVWDLDIAELSSGALGLPRASFSGPAELRAPLDPAEPMRWQTFPGFVLESRLGLRFDALSTASWSIGEDDCVEIELGARLTLETREDALDEAIGDVVISARDIRRCPGRCEESGDVELSFGAGKVVSWSHDGSDTITVHTPRERTFEVELPCAEERDGATAG